MDGHPSLGLHCETHRSSEEVLGAHSQHRAEVLGGGDGLPHQGEVDPQDDGAHHILHTALRGGMGFSEPTLCRPSPPLDSFPTVTQCPPHAVEPASLTPTSLSPAPGPLPTPASHLTQRGTGMAALGSPSLSLSLSQNPKSH